MTKVLSLAQSRYLKSALKLFYAEALIEPSPFPKEYRFQLAVIISQLDRNIMLDETSTPILRWTLDRILEQLEPGAWDQHLEAAYEKLFDVYPLDTPWYTRAKGIQPPEDARYTGSTYGILGEMLPILDDKPDPNP